MIPVPSAVSMTDYLSFIFIEDWLDAVTPNFEFIQIIDQSPPPHPIPTKRSLMTTPPPSNSGGRNQRRDTSPTKRPRLESSDEYGGDTGDNGETGWGEGGDEETPRSNVNQRRPNLPPIPFRGFIAPSITPSQSASLVSGSSNQSPSASAPSAGRSERSSVRGRRTRSPLKSANGLWVLDLPVVQIRMGDDPAKVLPEDVKDLFKSIDDIVTDHVEVFPLEIRNDVEAIVPRAQRKNDWFRPAQQISQQQTNEQETSYPRSRKPKSPLEVALHELDFLSDIGNTAQDCQVHTRAEVTWNMLVHQPLLQHALAGHATVQVEPSLTAKILAPFSPITSGRGGGSVIENKMIDFCLTLWLNDGKPRELLDDNDAKASSVDAKLISAIAEKVWSQPSDAQSVNQTGYPPLQFAPIACNIETKTSAIQQDGELQLSVWTAAWYQRITMLVPGRISQHGIITLPLLYIVGHDWKLSFASWREDRIEIIGSLVLGDTRTLLGSYTIIAVLRKIGDWIATDYRAWIEKMFL
ncbi:hypothetical protein AK830_g10831 [Neonectria ditissima]|uniref:PD-(D/E)XK nuclease-like domain-containing protein n=1 Tax=Neonectria ditissima TaxID=78410 RepID=A0A0P7B6E4_9HYPO|nr:hypothetical protein AK830_g10831 [Neonectria ditissima]